ncbi:hypothetical protein [Halobacillus litoralis]|uniref:hypothetical protein n=1 Tax=Halobacillus litoralis TaxID=45668 RepID=UPI001CFEF218|nr:hypothetical protein [Halobacillus litoralis]
MSVLRRAVRSEFLVLVTVLSLVGFVGLLPEEAHAKSLKQEITQEENLEYPDEIIAGVLQSLRKEKQGPFSLSEALVEIEQMDKVQIMDHYLNRNSKNVKPDEMRFVVDQVYGINLDAVSELGVGKQTSTYPQEVFERVRQSLGEDVSDTFIMELPKVKVMDLYVDTFNGKMNGADMRQMINAVFGINLTGIAGLEGTGVSLFSKGQWISQYENDLFIVHTGADDVDVWIYPTEHFKEQTDLADNPEELENRLAALGFSYNEEIGHLYYSNPTGESVPDSFKGKTMGTIIKFISQNYADLK